MRLFPSLVLLLVCCNVFAEEEQPDQADLMHVGSQLSLIADRLEQSAKDTIKQANLDRKSVIELRQQLKEQGEGDVDSKQSLALNNKLESAKSLQQAAPLIRAQAKQVRRQALEYLTAGMQYRYSEWINNIGPISISASGKKSHDGTMAHNTRIVSTKPALQEMREAPAISRNENMSLELSSAMSQDLPEEIDTSSFVLSRERQFFAHVELESSGNETGVVLNQIQSWRLVLTETNGDPVRNAVVNFNGHMPGHVHGLPTQPLLTEEIAPGIYRISGVKFQMAGWWVIELELNITSINGSEKVADNLRFNLAL